MAAEKPGRLVAVARYVFRRVLIVTGAFALTLAFFLVLPLFQAIGQPPPEDVIVRTVDTAALPPPPAPEIEEEKEEEPPPKEEAPQIENEPPLLDLAQLEVLLSPGGSGGPGGGTLFVPGLGDVIPTGEGSVGEAEISVRDLDQEPRALDQTQPVMTAQLRKKAPGKVNVLFLVDENGRVESPVVQSSSDAVFDAPALAAVKRWRFEPGKRNGQAVRFRMKVTVTFPKSG